MLLFMFRMLLSIKIVFIVRYLMYIKYTIGIFSYKLYKKDVKNECILTFCIEKKSKTF